MLNEQQQRAAAAVAEGKNVFVTGAGGNGKTFYINHIAAASLAKNVQYQICAPTGIAALNINGSTLHSFFRLSPSATILSDYMDNRPAKPPIRQISLLIIDEVSMVEASFLDLLDKICRLEKRQKDLPFGGIQIVLVGDFAQLGPVTKSNASPLYAFESNVWSELMAAGMTSVQLSISQRHPDPAFAQFMLKLRLGEIDDDCIQTLKQLSQPLTHRETECYVTDKAVVLESLNAAKDARNARKHADNPNPEKKFSAIYGGDNKRMKSCLAPDELSLKIGSPVLHLANLPNGLLNGSSGEVVDFTDDDKPMVKFYNPESKTYAIHIVNKHVWRAEERHADTRRMRVIATKTQFPLVLAYSITTHKSQSSTLDPVAVNLANVFAKSQAYVALSRARTSAGLHISGLKSFDATYLTKLFTPDKRVLDFYRSL